MEYRATAIGNRHTWGSAAFGPESETASTGRLEMIKERLTTPPRLKKERSVENVPEGREQSKLDILLSVPVILALLLVVLKGMSAEWARSILTFIDKIGR